MKVYDLVGIGFGPSNIALAIALEENFDKKNKKVDSLFLEKQASFNWHPNMLLEDADMQISFLKDLATSRNPSSKFTFLNYLFEKGRLQNFVNLKTFYPSRYEFNDYLSWCASHFEAQCRYNQEVVNITPVMDNANANTVKYLKVNSLDSTGKNHEFFTKSIVIAAGGYGNIPDNFKALKNDNRVFHSSTYLNSLSKQEKLQKVAIIGAGQSAAEIFLDIHNRSNASLDLVTRSWAMKPSDDSPFVNEIFNPESTDYVYSNSMARRDEILNDYKTTNYAASDIDLIQKIYSIFYEQRVVNKYRHNLLRRCEIKETSASEEGIILKIKNLDTGEIIESTYDSVILATGYKRNLHEKLLEPVKQYLLDCNINRDYSLQSPKEFEPLVILQGCCESTHGLSDTLLSNLAIRSEEICNCLEKHLNKVTKLA